MPFGTATKLVSKQELWLVPTTQQEMDPKGVKCQWKVQHDCDTEPRDPMERISRDADSNIQGMSWSRSVGRVGRAVHFRLADRDVLLGIFWIVASQYGLSRPNSSNLWRFGMPRVFSSSLGPLFLIQGVLWFVLTLFCRIFFFRQTSPVLRSPCQEDQDHFWLAR